jgi:hypothetical protein
MSTLAEIEAAVDRLPQPEQEILLEHLTRKLGARPPVTEGAQRERWLQKLDRLRNRGFTGKTGVPLQEISTTSAVSAAIATGQKTALVRRKRGWS